jgi:hypothetical protein
MSTPATKALLACALLAASAPAFADTPDSFERDRTLAEKYITRQQEKRCMDDFSSKIANHGEMQPVGSFRFNDKISQMVYHTLYWNGADRGVAFTVPVRLEDPKRGEVAANVACFYAVTGSNLVFQSSQQVAFRHF